jgi:hypothetical protein
MPPTPRTPASAACSHGRGPAAPARREVSNSTSPWALSDPRASVWQGTCTCPWLYKAPLTASRIRDMPEGPTSTGSKHRPATEPDRPDAGSLLCVANFPSNTGYAWTFIEELYAAIADRLALCGIHTWVAYPSLNGEPVPLAGSAASPFEHVVRLDRLSSVRATAEFVRRHRVRVVYLCDRSVWHPAYALLHLAGARRIIVHDHTSGERTPPRGLKRLAKRWRRGLPGAQADIVIGVSDYVMRRKVEVDLVPPSRVWRVWNSIRLRSESPLKEMLEERLGLNPLRPVIACAARAAEVKGVDHLLRAFDRLSASTDAGPARPTLLYLGDGPFMPELRRIRAALASRGDIVLGSGRVRCPLGVGGSLLPLRLGTDGPRRARGSLASRWYPRGGGGRRERSPRTPRRRASARASSPAHALGPRGAPTPRRGRSAPCSCTVLPGASDAGTPTPRFRRV